MDREEMTYQSLRQEHLTNGARRPPATPPPAVAWSPFSPPLRNVHKRAQRKADLFASASMELHGKVWSHEASSLVNNK